MFHHICKGPSLLLYLCALLPQLNNSHLLFFAPPYPHASLRSALSSVRSPLSSPFDFFPSQCSILQPDYNHFTFRILSIAVKITLNLRMKTPPKNGNAESIDQYYHFFLMHSLAWHSKKRIVLVESEEPRQCVWVQASSKTILKMEGLLKGEVRVCTHCMCAGQWSITNQLNSLG